jgi:hypothetical protein
MEALVHPADAFKARDGFLADIASFVEIDGVGFESDFLREGVFGEFAPPDRHAVKDSEEFDFLGRKFAEIGGFFLGIDAEEAEAFDG